MNPLLIQSLLDDVEKIRQKLLLLLSDQTSENGDANTAAKRPNGRLSEAGIKWLRSMVDNGKTDAEIARELDVTKSAVSYQRNCYIAEKGGHQ